MLQQFNLQFEKAVRFVVEHAPMSEENSRKPLLPHVIRVGVYLYEHNYSHEIILAGLLHDMLEYSGAGDDELEKQFGAEVLRLVKANTKDDSILDPVEKTNELIKRCVEAGEEALIIKAADIMDSVKYYTRTENEKQLEYCQRNMRAIFGFKPDSFTDPIFEELRQHFVE